MNKLSTLKTKQTNNNKETEDIKFLQAYCRSFICVPCSDKKNITVWL